MKKIYTFLFCLLIFSITTACEKGNQATSHEELQAKAEKFKDFAAKFPNETKTLPATFGEEWLDRQISPVKIDSFECNHFIYGNLVLNHQLLISGSDEKEKELDKTKSYYIICKIPLGQNFISLIISDLEKDATSTYLLNFSQEGKYISGILIQGRYILQDGTTSNKITRESVVSDSQMILCQEKLVGRNKFINYDISPEGKILHRN
jgi:hypothetical protein